MGEGEGPLVRHGKSACLKIICKRAIASIAMLNVQRLVYLFSKLRKHFYPKQPELLLPQAPISSSSGLTVPGSIRRQRSAG